MLQAALLGGLFNGVLSALPIVSVANLCCCCAWIVGGGVLAAYVYRQNSAVPITPAAGAQVGLMAGIVGAVVWLVVSQAVDLVLGPFVREFVAQMARNAADMPPEARAWLDAIARNEGSRYLGGFVLMLVGGSIFSTIGGLIGGAYFRDNVPPALGGPIAPPPLP